jgi:hypothetical protein
MKIIAFILVFNFAALAQPPTQQPWKPINNLADLEAGMPQDYVLASLKKIYRLQEEVPSPSGKIEPTTRGWIVWWGKDYLGELLFRNGVLSVATRSLYQGSGDAELVERLFSVIFDNSGPSHIEATPYDLTRTRDHAFVIESQEMIIGKGRSQTLKFIMSQKHFNLDVWTEIDEQGKSQLQQVYLDEVIVPKSEVIVPK